MTFPSGWGVFAAGQHGQACRQHEWKGRGCAEQRPALPRWVHSRGPPPGGNAATAWKRQEGFLRCAHRCSVRATPLGEAGNRECDALVSTLWGLFLLLIQSNCWFPSLLLTYRIPVVASVVLVQGKCSLHPGAGGSLLTTCGGKGAAGVLSVGPGMLADPAGHRAP